MNDYDTMTTTAYATNTYSLLPRSAASSSRRSKAATNRPSATNG